ncbi:hypothetical protein [Streptomyces sp. NPDC127098]|uniref:hypothetical protein n=1 Tax=Streptomyces sp. NPDC127098 TaxID=3347137 RepID=UPI00364A4942
MSTFSEIVGRELTDLESAAEAFEAAAGGLAEVKVDYGQRVASVSTTGSVWVGEAADAASRQFSNTEAELGAAEAEARALAGLFRDGYAELTGLRAQVVRLAIEVREAGFTVDDRGQVLDALGRSDIPELADQRAEARYELQAEASRLLGLFAEADRNLRLALEQVVEGRDERRAGIFNGGASGDADQVRAGRAAELAGRVAAGDELSAAEVAELRQLVELNADDQEFTRLLLDDLGADGLLRMTAQIGTQLAGDGDVGTRLNYTHLQDHMATALATATRVPTLEPGSAEWGQWSRTAEGQFYTRFMSGLRESGTARYAVDGVTDQEVRGYHLLATLMEGGPDRGDDAYAQRFLHDLADDIRVAETEDPDLWQLRAHTTGPDGLDDDDLAWLALDPMDTALDAMSRQPAVAAAYLDPAGDNDRLEYLLNERSWDHLVTAGPGTSYTITRGDDSGTGFAAALQSATTGVPADTSPSATGLERSEAGVRIMQDLVDELATNTSRIGDGGDFAFMRPELARMTGAYMAEFQDHISDGIVVMPLPEQVVDLRGLEVAEFLTQLGRDPEAYGVLTGAQQGYTAASIDFVMNEPTESTIPMAMRVQDSAVAGAQIAGLLSEARADAIYEAGIASDEAFNSNVDMAEEWAGVVIDEAVGRLAERYPVAGPAIEFGVGFATEATFEALRRDESEQYTADAQGLYLSGYHAAIAAAEQAVTAAAPAGGHNEDTVADLHNAVTEVVSLHFGRRISWDPPIQSG